MSRAALALGLEAIFFALAFGWRSWIQWRRTGSTGFIRPRRDASKPEIVGSVGFMLALLLLVLGPIADLIGLSRIGWLDAPWTAVTGTVAVIAGIVMTIVAQLAMGNSWRIGVDPNARTELVTTGLFARVRNPIFTAMIVAATGAVLLVPNAMMLTALVVLVIALEVQVRLIEEPYLTDTHGATYERYRTTSGRFLPNAAIRGGTQ